MAASVPAGPSPAPAPDPSEPSEPSGTARDPRRSLIIGGAIALAVLLVLAAVLGAGVAVVVAGRPG